MARHAIPYASVGTQFVPYQNYGLATWPDGGLRTTVLDFGRFVGMIMQGGSLRGVRVMQAATVQAMLAPQDVTIEYDGFPKGSVRQAIFWMIGSVGGKDSQRYWHTGSDPGAATLVTLDVRRRIGVVAFVNTDATSVISADVQHVVDLIFKATGR
jgi:CubicO group peptidase (beta-lactamase class C family)